MLGFGVALGISGRCSYLPFYFGFLLAGRRAAAEHCESDARCAAVGHVPPAVRVRCCAWLAYSASVRSAAAQWRAGLLVTLGLVLSLTIALVAVSWIACSVSPVRFRAC